MKSNTLVLSRSFAIFIFAIVPIFDAIAARPVPTVTGPIAVTATSYPFGAADHTLVPQNLKSLGYLERSF